MRLATRFFQVRPRSHFVQGRVSPIIASTVVVGTAGKFDFSAALNSGLLVLLEDI